MKNEKESINILKSAIKCDFTQIHNDIFRCNIKGLAGFIYIYLVHRSTWRHPKTGKPWKFYTSDIANHVHECESTVGRALKYLEDLKLLKRVRTRVSGRYSESVWVIFHPNIVFIQGLNKKAKLQKERKKGNKINHKSNKTYGEKSSHIHHKSNTARGDLTTSNIENNNTDKDVSNDPPPKRVGHLETLSREEIKENPEQQNFITDPDEQLIEMDSAFSKHCNFVLDQFLEDKITADDLLYMSTREFYDNIKKRNDNET